MSDQPQWLLLKPTHYPQASDFRTVLGTIVKFYHEPQSNRTPTDPAFFAGDFYLHDKVLSDVVFSSGQAKKSAFAIRLEHLLGMQHSQQGTANFDFNSKVIRSIRLRDYDQVFEELQEDDEVKKKLKEWLLPFGKAYMIVGALSFENAELEQSTVGNTTNAAHVQAPLRQVEAAQFGGVTSDETGNPTIDVSAEQDEHAQIAGTGIGTQIFALQYKVVRRTLVIGRPKLKAGLPRSAKGHFFSAGRGQEFDDEEGEDEKEVEEEEDHDSFMNLGLDDVSWSTHDLDHLVMVEND